MRPSSVPITFFVAAFAIAAAPGAASAAGTQAPAAEGRSGDLRAIDSFVEQQMKDKNLPGVAVGVWVGDKPRVLKAYGAADRTTGLKRTVEQPFRIASITKTFTATAILQLVDEGQLKPSDPLAKWYPDFPNAQTITIDNLLRMRSGIPDSLDAKFLERWFANPLESIDPAASIASSAARVNEFKPAGTATVYTNVNYILLQEIVRKVSGRSLGQQIERGVLHPLRMARSSYPVTPRLPGALRGYSARTAGGVLLDKTELNPDVPGGAGAMISTLSDLHRYAKKVCAGGLIKPKTQRDRVKSDAMAGEPDFVRYGAGLVFLGEWCGHNGTIFGFSSEMFYLPAEDATIVVNVNRLDLDDQSKSADIFLGISKILFPKHVRW